MVSPKENGAGPARAVEPMNRREASGNEGLRIRISADDFRLLGMRRIAHLVRSTDCKNEHEAEKIGVREGRA